MSRTAVLSTIGSCFPQNCEEYPQLMKVILTKIKRLVNEIYMINKALPKSINGDHR